MPLHFKLSWFGLDIMVHLISSHISSKWFFLWLDGIWTGITQNLPIRFNYEIFNDFFKIRVLVNS